MKSQRRDRPHLQHVSELVRTASLLVSCRACGKLHKPECPLDLHPICPACTGRYKTESFHMGGCHPLNEEKIDEHVTRVSPGNYALGFLDGGTFIVFYVGRADSDVNDRLHSGPLPVGVVVDGRYTHFQFSYAASPQAAFVQECHDYHQFGGSYGLDNERHPGPSEGESWKCPVHGHHHG